MPRVVWSSPTLQDTAVTSGLSPLPSLTARQQSEYDFHRVHAESRHELIDQPVAGDIVSESSRRPWNAYWSMYDRIIAANPAGKRVLVPGSGFGDDAIRLAMLGARVSAFDLSPESVDIARARAERCGYPEIDFRVMPAEALGHYADDAFDMVVFVDILHHVDIPATLPEIVRVIKPGGMIVGDELYTHSTLQRWRESAPITKIAYPLMQRWIYNDLTPYITPEEHKIDEQELAIVLATMVAPSVEFFGIAEGRLFPSRMVWASKIDRSAIRLSRSAARRLGSRVVFSGEVGGS
jgi:2-polyprenyl-3-methyl-5-hydroxy-6-metoxy-1,4-benzoquinol methylase